jgi:hypothetical protein
VPDLRPDTDRATALLELTEAIVRAEMQAIFLCRAVEARAAAGRDCAGLHRLIDSAEARLAALERRRERLLDER